MKHFLCKPAILLYCLIAFFNLAQVQAQCGTAESRWLGTTWTVPPDATRTVYFDANYTSTTSISACQVFVSDGIIVTFLGGHTLYCNNNLTVSTFPGTQLIFENGASLVQSSATAVNIGSIEYKRETNNVSRYDFTYFCSPVRDQILYNIDDFLTNANNLGITTGYATTLADKYFD